MLGQLNFGPNKPSVHNGGYFLSTVVSAEIHCWNDRFHIRTALS